MKLLIGIPSPRDISEFTNNISKINHDKFWVKYTGYVDKPYLKIQKFFLEHGEYTHLGLLPDDLIPTTKELDLLIDDIHKHDFPVLSGICNVGATTNGKMDLVICKNLPSMQREGREYHWIKKDELNPNEPIIQVSHVGFPLIIIRRDVVEQIEFTGDGPVNDDQVSYAVDVDFSNKCNKLNIPIHVDTRAYFNHIRFGGPLKVGVLKPTWWYDQVGKSRITDPSMSSETQYVKLSMTEYVKRRILRPIRYAILKHY